MMLAVAMSMLFQVMPLPTASAMPLPAESAPASAPATPSSQSTPLPQDCVRYEPERCPFDTRKRPAESDCVRAAQAQERCAQQTTGFMHYVVLMRAGSLWGGASALDSGTGASNDGVCWERAG